MRLPIAVDYTSGNAFYTAVPQDTGGFVGVGVISPSGLHRRLVEYGKQPRAIVLDPKSGWVSCLDVPLL